MSRYKHFDDELSAVETHEAAVLPELDVDEAHQLEFRPQLRNFSANPNITRNKSQWNFFSSFLVKRTRLERILLGVIAILLLVLILNHLLSFKNHSITKIDDDLCLSSTCIQMAASINNALNQSVDPCQDFHQFACGKWIKTNIIPKGHFSWSTAKELTRKNLIILKSILEQTLIDDSSNVFNGEQEAVKFYRSCLNTTEIEKLGIKPLENFLDQNLNLTIRKWIELDQNETYSKTFFDLNRILSKKFGFSNILPFAIGPDDKNSSWNVIHLNQPQLNLDSRDYYMNSSSNNRTDLESDSRNKIIRETYRNVSIALLELLGFSRETAEKRIDDIIQFEIELATISLPMEILQKPNETYYLISLKEMNELFREVDFDLKIYFEEILNLNGSNPVKVGDDDKIIVFSFDFVSKISKLLKDYLLTARKSHIVIDHLIFSLIFDLSSHLSSVFEKLTLPLLKELNGIDSIPERWEYCVRETDGTFGYALSALYVKAVFGEEDRVEAKELIRTIRQMFDENFDKLDWIDQPSRIEAKKKLMKITEKVGYPDFIYNRTTLNERYIGYSMNETDYFTNGIQVLERERRRSLQKFRQKVDTTDWSMTPRTVNAYYTPSANEIVFPAGILQPPFFHKDLPLSINYGAIGTVIGHEITHGFDDQGREYDADGNMKSWWTKSAWDQFEQRTKCFVKQYSEFSLDGQSENGQRTLSENIADNGGLKLSYLAYQNHKKRSKSNVNNRRLPGLSYSSDQLFFIGFAHSWCNVETRNAMHFDLINDPHSPARFRILGSAANSEAFAQAFSCSSESRMNPSNKCRLW